MAKYTQTKIARLFEKVPIYNSKGKYIGYEIIHRDPPTPPTPRKARHFKDLPYPVMMSPGQIINLRKESKRQMASMT